VPKIGNIKWTGALADDAALTTISMIRVRSMCARIAILLLSVIAFAIGSVSPTLGQGMTGQRFVLPKKARLDRRFLRDAEAREASYW